MVYNLGPKSLQWSLLGGGGGKSRRFFTHGYYILINASKQLMCQRHRIVPPGVSSSNAL